MQDSNKDYCEYEPVLPRIKHAKVLVIDNLIKCVENFSTVAHNEPDFDAEAWVKEERTVAMLAMENIAMNITRLIEEPEWRTIHLSELSLELLEEYNPDAVIISGTLRDFDLYHPSMISNFDSIITSITIPVLGICGGHQLVGQAFRAKVVTMDGFDPNAKRKDRIREYEYQFVEVLDNEDPIFKDLFTVSENQRRGKSNSISIWQNHGLMLDSIPEGFKLLATSEVCHNQMMVKSTDRQLIYTVQFHVEKSFEDWRKNPSPWEHHNESRDGRHLFENFIIEALNYNKRFNN